MKEIILTQGQVALVDDEDYEWLNYHGWYATKFKNTFYAGRTVPGEIRRQKMIKMHHAILGKPPKGFETDHEDGNGLNNQRENLRFVTRRQNTQNRKNAKKKTSLFPGVSWHDPTGKWIARIWIDGKQNYLGLFASEQTAFNTYKTVVESLGEEVIDR